MFIQENTSWLVVKYYQITYPYYTGIQYIKDRQPGEEALAVRSCFMIHLKETRNLYLIFE